jgi:hypothetical protein
LGWGISRQKREVHRVFQQLLEIEELLGAGMVPPANHWEALQTLSAPWGSLISDSLRELRASGGAVLPTLKRLKGLASDQERALADAKARSSQAMAQAGGCAMLIPVFGAVLYSLLPGVSEYPWTWSLACLIALLLAGMGGIWLLSMAENARWAGLPRSARNWILASQCAGERFLALVRAGSPADLAWVKTSELLSREAPGLAMAWGASIWKAAPATHGLLPSGIPSRILIDAGEGLRKAVQLSLMEGRPCGERVEAVLASLSHEIKSRTEAELSLLTTRALKPLFIFVAPGLFALLGLGLYFSFRFVSV